MHVFLASIISVKFVKVGGKLITQINTYKSFTCVDLSACILVIGLYNT